MTADKLLSYTGHDGEGQPTIHPRMSLPRGKMGMGDIPTTNTVMDDSFNRIYSTCTNYPTLNVGEKCFKVRDCLFVKF